MFGQLALLVGAGLLGPLLAGGRRPLAPVLVGELIAGAIIGRTGFGVLDPITQPFPVFSVLGFAMLMLAAGNEVDIRSPALRQGALRGGLALGGAAAAGITLALLISAVLHIGHPQLLAVLLAGSSAAVAFPIIEEAGLQGPSIGLLIGWITLADAATALLLPLSLSGPERIPAALAGDGAMVLVGLIVIVVGTRLPEPPLKEAKRESKHRRWALQLRLSILLLLVFGAIAERTGASLLVAGFGAGIVLRSFHQPRRLVQQLNGLASGFFVPAFFVLLGATLDLRRLLDDPSAILLALALATASVCVHLAGAAIAGREERLATGLVASAQLGLPAAAAALGLATHSLSPPVAAALVAGGCLTLVPATIGAKLLSRDRSGSTAPSQR